MMAVLPEFRDQGPEDLMIDWATSLADAKSIPCYTTAPEDKTESWVRQGFETKGTIKLELKDGRTLAIAALVREAHRAASS